MIEILDDRLYLPRYVIWSVPEKNMSQLKSTT